MNRELESKINVEQFIDWLNKTNPKLDDPYYNYGIDCNYGFELEFLSNESRQVIGSRVNSCMMKQNDNYLKLDFYIFSWNNIIIFH